LYTIYIILYILKVFLNLGDQGNLLDIGLKEMNLAHVVSYLFAKTTQLQAIDALPPGHSVHNVHVRPEWGMIRRRVEAHWSWN
jgi:hypothetical protein